MLFATEMYNTKVAVSGFSHKRPVRVLSANDDKMAGMLRQSALQKTDNHNHQPR